MQEFLLGIKNSMYEKYNRYAIILHKIKSLLRLQRRYTLSIFLSEILGKVLRNDIKSLLTRRRLIFQCCIHPQGEEMLGAFLQDLLRYFVR